MEQQTILIKGMVCNRCLLTIETELLQMGHTPVKMSLGEVSYMPNKAHDSTALEERLTLLGFSLLENKNVKMTKEVKRLVEEVYGGDYDFPERFRFSDLVRQRLQKEYATVSDAFIATEKKSIEQYIIEFRINKIKEYLVYTDLTLADIAFRLNFNSVAHLSTQFKQQTGLTPSYFKNIRRQKSGAFFSQN
jgi:AraC family transcriptional regulator